MPAGNCTEVTYDCPYGRRQCCDFTASRDLQSDDVTGLAVTLSAYRSRWRPESADDRYASLTAKLEAIGRLSTPTLMVHGGADTCDPPTSSEGQEDCFTGRYGRLVLPGVGHFPAREASNAVADAVLKHVGSSGP